MKASEILDELKSLGTASIKKVHANHGAQEPFYGVKVGDMKPIMKRIKKDYKLSLELFDSGISDAMYLAGLIADSDKMTKEDLQKWANKASWYMISEYPVAWVAAESRYGMEMALQWIESPNEGVATAGWATLTAMASCLPDDKFDLKKYDQLLDRVAKSIHQSPNRVRYTMNVYVIAIGGYIVSLSDKAYKVAAAIGKVSVNVGNTACKVPLATDYIDKIRGMGRIGHKKKTARC